MTDSRGRQPWVVALRGMRAWLGLAVAAGFLAGCVPVPFAPRAEEDPMPLDADARVSAQVLMKSASGQTPGTATPITAETIATFAPAPDAVDRATRYFRSQGFEVGPFVGISFSIEGTVATFEKVFATRLERTARGGIETAGDGGLELPLAGLPPDVREVVAAVTFTPPPDFGPGNP